MKALLTVFSALVIGLGAAAFATAGADYRHADRGAGFSAGTHDRLPGRIFQHLDLSAGQRERIRDIMAEGAAERRDEARALREARRDLRALGFSQDYDAAHAGELAQRQAELSAALALARTERMRAVYEVLTPEQREKLADWRAGKRQPARDRAHD